MSYRANNNLQGEFYENEFEKYLRKIYPNTRIISNNTHGMDKTLKFTNCDVFFEVKSVNRYVQAGKNGIIKNSVKFKETDYFLPDFLAVYILENSHFDLKIIKIKRFKELCDKLKRLQAVFTTNRGLRLFHVGLNHIESVKCVKDLRNSILKVKSYKENNNWV